LVISRKYCWGVEEADGSGAGALDFFQGYGQVLALLDLLSGDALVQVDLVRGSGVKRTTRCAPIWCQRNAGFNVSNSIREEVHRKLRDVFRSLKLDFAQRRASRMISEYRSRFPDLADWMEETIREPLAVFRLP
jgi:hypothetical protein